MTEKLTFPAPSNGTGPIRVATRRSPLALAQARLVADQVTGVTGIPTERGR